MSHTNSVINFNIGASNAGAIQEFQLLGRELDKLEEKKKKLSQPTAGGAKTASDRQINKALGQDSAGDFLELFGISEKSLATIKTAGIALGGMNAVLTSTTKILNGIRQDKDFTEIYTEIAKGIPIFGGVAAAADEAGKAIGEYYYDLDGLRDAEKRAREDFNNQKKLIESTAASGTTAREQLAIASSANPEVTRAQIEFDKISKDVEGKRKQVQGLGRGSISNEARAAALKDLDDTLAAAADKVVRAQAEVDRKKAEMRQKERDELLKKLQDDLIKQQREEVRIARETAEKIAEEKAKVNEDIMRGSAQLLDEIAGLEDKQREKMIGIGKQTRTGALAAGGGIGTANQLASQQRASFNPALKLMQDAAKKDDEKLKYLRGLWEATQRGDFVPIFN